MRDGERIFVSGLGVVNSGFWGAAEAAAAFAEPNPQPTEVGDAFGYLREGGSRRAMLVDTAPQREWLAPMAARRMSPASRFAVCAALMAVADAGLQPADLAGPTAVVMGTTYGAASVTEKILRQILLEGPEAVSPALFTESVANAPAAQIALAVKARAANVTVTQRQASVAVAVQRGLAEIRSGRASRVLAGVVDEMNPLLHAILERFDALARPDENGLEAARPFDRRATGWLAAEGAAVVVLESEGRVRERNGRGLAEVIGAASAFDPNAPRSGWPRDASGVAPALEAFLERCRQGRFPDIVVSSACGHRNVDRFEADIVRRLSDGSVRPPVFAPAATAGFHGAALLGGTVLAATGSAFGRTPGFAEPDPGAGGVVPHDGRRLPRPGSVLMNASAPGGSIAWALFGPGDA